MPGHFQHRKHEGLVPGHRIECAPRADEIPPVDPFKQPRIETPEVGGAPVIRPKGIRLGNLDWYGSGVPWDRRWPGRILAIRHPTAGVGVGRVELLQHPGMGQLVVAVQQHDDLMIITGMNDA